MNHALLRISGTLACGMALSCAIACTTPQRETPIPLKPTAVQTSANSSKPSERQQVIAEYTGYTRALTPADDSRNPATVRVLLQPYVGPSAVRGWIRTFARLWRLHEIAYGTPIFRIFYVGVSRDRALVRACENTTADGLRNYLTDQIVPGSNLSGSVHLYQVTVLHRADGHWYIAMQTTVDLPCKS